MVISDKGYTSTIEHGTWSAGVVGAAQDNKTCGVGVAYQCNIGSEC